MFLLHADQPGEIELFLKVKGWIAGNDTVFETFKAGEGNMNYVLRIVTATSSLNIKQSRNYVEKYPHIPAPDSRVLTEGLFYNTISRNDILKNSMPGLIGLDEENKIMALEDLGTAVDYSYLYNSTEKLSINEIEKLLNYLDELHNLPITDSRIANTEMRILNHEHIFNFPFLMENGFNLDTVQRGLQELSLTYKKNEALKNKVNLLGGVYLSAGTQLLHGDFYPGSWLKTEQGIKIIDPEFCFHGAKEFDLGIFIAHLLLSNHNKALVEKIISGHFYKEPFDKTLVKAFAGVEIMRRLIGIAQLPILTDIKSKSDLMQYAYRLIMNEATA